MEEAAGTAAVDVDNDEAEPVSSDNDEPVMVARRRQKRDLEPASPSGYPMRCPPRVKYGGFSFPPRSFESHAIYGQPGMAPRSRSFP